MKNIEPKILDDGATFREEYESTPLAYSVDEGEGQVPAINLDDSLTQHPRVGEVVSEQGTYSVITQRANSRAIDYNPDDYSDFYIPGQNPIITPGSSSGNMDYSSATSLLSLKNTGSSVRSGGRGVSSKVIEGSQSHVVNRSSDYITRDIKNTHANSITISESVTVSPGKISAGSSLKKLVTGHGWALAAGNKANKPITWDTVVTVDVYQDCDVRLDCYYASYLRVAGQNFSRGTASLNFCQMVPGGYNILKTLKKWTHNVGYRQTQYTLKNSNMLQGSQMETFTIPNVKQGKYYLIVEFKDTYQDTDVDGSKYPFYVWANSIVYQKINSGYKTDNSYATVELIDFGTNQVIQKYKVCEGGGTQDVNFTVPGNKSYRIRYTLYRGDGKIGGVYGDGASMYVHGGNVTQYWEEYGFKDPVDKFPYVPPTTQTPPFTGDVEVGSPGGGATVPAPSVYCWLDYFRLYSASEVEPEPDCFGNDITVDIREGTHLVDSYTFNESDSFIRFSIENNTSVEKTYSISFSYDHDCDGNPPIHLYGGRFLFDETREPEESSVYIDGFYVEQEKDIWYGAEGSKLQFNVYDHNNTLIKSYMWDATGEYDFNVNNLGYLPYPNYRAEFVTTQLGVLSPVTNIDYRANFYLDEFIAREVWKPVPLPFNSALEFYIDDVLVGTWNSQGGGVFKYKVPKGKHKYKWVFTNNNSENTWDFAEIDWFRLTNWICDAIIITPYCEPGRGDDAVEALIKCLLEVWRQRPDGCVFGNKKIWLFT